MAILCLGDMEMEVPDGEQVKEAAEEMGVPFGCEEGICGTCMVEVIDGMENLGELTEAEEDMGVGENERLMCQCSIRGGRVTISY
jgi:ferredoxin